MRFGYGLDQTKKTSLAAGFFFALFTVILFKQVLALGTARTACCHPGLANKPNT
jgi:hypothetical protein